MQGIAYTVLGISGGWCNTFTVESIILRKYSEQET